MGLFSSIFGGGSSQQTTVGTSTETNVDVQNYIENIIDTTGIEAVIQSIRDLFAQSSAGQQQISEQTALILLAQAQSDVERNASDIQKNQTDVARNVAQINFFGNISTMLDKAVRGLAIAAVLYGLYRMLK